MVLIGDQSSMLPAAIISISILFYPFPRRLCGSAPSPCHLPVAGPGKMHSCTWDDKIQLFRSLDLAELYSLVSAELLKVQDNRNWAWYFKKSCRGGVTAKPQWEDKLLVMFLDKHKKAITWPSYSDTVTPFRLSQSWAIKKEMVCWVLQMVQP